MAENAYHAYYAATASQAHFDHRAQPYPYPTYAQQQQPHPQLGSQPRYPSDVQAYNALPNYASPPSVAARSPLPPPPRSPALPRPLSAYGRSPQPPHPHQPQPQPQLQHQSPYQQQPTTPYAPSFDPRQTYSYIQPQSSAAIPAPALVRRPLPDPHTRPESQSSIRPRLSLAHRPTLSVSAVPTAKPSFGTPTSPHSSPPRPLPQPQSQSQQPGIPRSFARVDLARSPSPSKGLPSPAPTLALSGSEVQPAFIPGQKFVPHWKRALPAPGQPTSSSHSHSRSMSSASALTTFTHPLPHERRGTVSGVAPDLSPLAQRQKSLIRPLPTPHSSPAAVAMPSLTQAQTQSQSQTQTPGRGGAIHPLPPIPGTPRSQGQEQQVSSPPRSLPSIPPAPAGGWGGATGTAAVSANEGGGENEANSSDDEELAAHVLLSRPNEQQTRHPAAADAPPQDEESDRRVSPGYGILDMPSKTRNQSARAPTPGDPTQQKQGSDGRDETQAQSQPQPQSATLRFAAMSLRRDAQSPAPTPASPSPPHSSAASAPRSRPPSRTHGYSNSVPVVSTYSPAPSPSPLWPQPQPSSPRWPSGLPPLPRAPGSPAVNNGGSAGIDDAIRRQIFGRGSGPGPGQRPPVLDLSLDDAPPPSLRREPSPAPAPVPAPVPARPMSAFAAYRNANANINANNRANGRDAGRSAAGKPFAPANIRTDTLNGAPSASAAAAGALFMSGSARALPSPLSPQSGATSPSPSSAVSTSSIFTLSAFPAPLPSASSVTPPTSAGHPDSAKSASSMFSLSSFPQPPSRANNPALNREAAIHGTGRGTVGGARQPIPKITFPANADDDSEESDGGFGPVISVSGPGDDAPGGGIPSISIGLGDDDGDDNTYTGVPQISLGGDGGSNKLKLASKPSPLERLIRKGNGLACGGCGGAIVGRTVNAMGARWHPGCFRCSVCDELLEHLSSYEHEGRAYCGLDYHELFAPRCYHCKTVIVDERFITLDDPELGKRTYHELHFFCAECGDPFLNPSSMARGPGEQTFSGDGKFVSGEDDVGFTVYRGHPYCESCHVRLRLPKCKRCKKAIRDGKRAVEALGGKWCWECFVCASCEKPFENPSFFQRDGMPYCEHCFSIMIKNEL